MRTFIASALVATYVAAEGSCDDYDYDKDLYWEMELCEYDDNQDSCQYVCDYAHCDGWGEGDISYACDFV